MIGPHEIVNRLRTIRYLNDEEWEHLHEHRRGNTWRTTVDDEQR
ncbi:hypothetical protein [Halostella pelagica]|nr:hypothetical protein [Halostella pelagica]